MTSRDSARERTCLNTNIEVQARSTRGICQLLFSAMEFDDEPLGRPVKRSKGSIITITNGSALHPISCPFDANVLAQWNIPFVKAQLSFNEKARIEPSDVCTIVIQPPFMSETDPYLVYWFHHLLTGASGRIVPKHLWPTLQLYDFLYGNEEHIHLRDFLGMANNACGVSAGELNEADYESLREFHQHQGTQWPASVWTYKKDEESKYKAFGEILYRHQEWDLLVAHATSLPVTFSRPLRLGTHERLDRLTGGVWSVMQPFLGDNFEVRGHSEQGFVWSQLCEDDRNPKVGLTLVIWSGSADKERELFTRLSSTHADRCIVGDNNELSECIIFVNDAPIKILIDRRDPDHPFTLYEMRHDLDLQEIVYQGGEELHCTPRALRAWNRRQVHYADYPDCSSVEFVSLLNFTWSPDALAECSPVGRESDDFIPLSSLSMSTNLKILRSFYPTFQFCNKISDILAMID
jgi:hypothetical protein